MARSTANVILFRCFDERCDPLVLVPARLAQPDRHVALVAEIQVFLDYALVSGGPVFVERIDDVFIERRPENFEVRVPLSPAEDQNVIASSNANWD